MPPLPTFRILSKVDLKIATRNFRSDERLGEEGPR